MPQLTPKLRNVLVIVLTIGISACVTPPKGVKPVSGFELKRYLGKWYEVARLDNRFEKGLSQITADYSLRNDGGINVINRGFNQHEGIWQQADGKAYFVGDKTTGHLKVSFFGPFYSGYCVIELDKSGYQYALVSGSDRSYLWILARTPFLDPAVLNHLIDIARKNGFNTDELIFVSQE